MKNGGNQTNYGETIRGGESIQCYIVNLLLINIISPLYLEVVESNIGETRKAVGIEGGRSDWGDGGHGVTRPRGTRR